MSKVAQAKTLVEKGDFKGHPTVSIWEVDPVGNKVGKYPIISFGVGKGIAVLRHAEEIKQLLNLTDGDISA